MQQAEIDCLRLDIVIEWYQRAKHDFYLQVFASKFEGTRQVPYDNLKGAIVVDSEAVMRHYCHCIASSNQRLTKQNGDTFFWESYEN